MNTAPKLQKVVAFLLGEAELDGRWYGDETLSSGRPAKAPYWWRTVLREAMSELAPPSGEGVDAFSVMRSAFVTSESCGPEGDYRLVFRFRSLEALQQAHREWVTTPQFAPVDVVGPDEVVVHREILGNADAALAISNHKGSAWSEHESPRYEIRELLGLPYEKRTTPPPASQERGGEGWRVVRDAIAIHQSFNTTADMADWLRDLLPPSSAAEASINSPEIDSKLIPDAAEQAKPDDEIVTLYGADDKPFASWPRSAMELKWPELTPPAEQAQAGESYLRKFQDDNTHFVESLPRKISEPDRPWFVNERGTELRGHAYEFSGDTHVVPVAVAQAEIDRLNAVLLRRLAGGVTVDDAMTERACICHYPRWEVFSDPTRIAARASMRRLLVAALGAK